MQAARLIALSQIILGVCILISIAIVPHYFLSLDQGGISNYGTESRTLPFFSVGFGAAAIGTLLASLLARRSGRIEFRLLALSLSYAAVLFTTFGYKLNPATKQLHEATAILLFVIMLTGAFWIRFRSARTDRIVQTAFPVFCIGFILVTLTFSGVLHLLFTAQLLCGISFGYMLFRAVHHVNDQATL